MLVTPRKGILDPQGRTVEQSLKSLGFASVSGVKIGRYITLDIEAKTRRRGARAASKMCEQLLANPNIEDFRFEVEGRMKWGVIRFPGSLDDVDAMYGLRDVMGQDVALLWHKDESLRGAECIVLPGGFSYGDYLRCGAIARFSPIMKSVAKFAADGGLVIGICNGFQILTRGASAARRADAQSLAVVHLRPRSSARRECEDAVHAARRARATFSRCRSSMARDATSRRKRNSARWRSAGR